MINALISKTGKDVLDNSNLLRDYILNIAYPQLKIVSEGTFVTPINIPITIMHNLGYKPFAFVLSSMIRNDSLGSVTEITRDFQIQLHDWDVYNNGFNGGTPITRYYWGHTRIYNDRIIIDVGCSHIELDPDPPSNLNVSGKYFIFAEQLL